MAPRIYLFIFFFFPSTPPFGFFFKKTRPKKASQLPPVRSKFLANEPIAMNGHDVCSPQFLGICPYCPTARLVATSPFCCASSCSIPFHGPATAYQYLNQFNLVCSASADGVIDDCSMLALFIIFRAVINAALEASLA